jgi:hypothetical protein
MEKHFSISLQLLIYCLPLLPITAWATEQDNRLPSRELLEFLAEFSEVDEETYELLEFHAQRDLEKAKADPDQENNDE